MSQSEGNDDVMASRVILSISFASRLCCITALAHVVPIKECLKETHHYTVHLKIIIYVPFSTGEEARYVPAHLQRDRVEASVVLL